MHFRSESNGISAIRGKSFINASFLNPKFSAAIYRAISVGSPITLPSLSTVASLLNASAINRV
jgi:hypothetical protein